MTFTEFSLAIGDRRSNFRVLPETTTLHFSNLWRIPGSDRRSGRVFQPVGDEVIDEFSLSLVHSLSISNVIFCYQKSIKQSAEVTKNATNIAAVRKN